MSELFVGSEKTFESINNYNINNYFRVEQSSYDKSFSTIANNGLTRTLRWNKKSYSLYIYLTALKDCRIKLYVSANGSNESYGGGGQFNFSIRKNSQIVSEFSDFIDLENYDINWLSYSRSFTFDETTTKDSDDMGGIISKGDKIEITLSTPKTDMPDNNNYSLTCNITAIGIPYNGLNFYTGTTAIVPEIPKKIYVGNEYNRPQAVKKIYYIDKGKNPKLIWTAPTT